MRTLKIYFSQCFNFKNLPETLAVLTANCSSESVTVAEVLDSDEYSRTVRVSFSATDANKKRANLLKFANDESTGFWYLVTGYRWVNASVLELSLSISGILTTRIFDPAGSVYTTVPVSLRGTITRESSKDGDPVNMLPEPFSPTSPKQRFVISHGYPDLGTAEGPKTYYTSTLDLKDKALAENETILATYGTDDKITSYEIKLSPIKTSTPSKFKMWTPFSSQTNASWSYAGLAVYEDTQNGNNQTFNNLNAVGLDSCIKDRWSIPETYAFTTARTDGSGGVDTISSREIDAIDVLLSQTTAGATSTTIKNEKARYYPCNVLIVSMASGNTRKFRWVDICSPQNTATASFQAIANPAPDGKPYIYPVYFERTQQNVLYVLGLVPGARWLHPGETAEGKTGRLLSNFQTSEAISNQGIGAVSDVLGAIGGIAGADSLTGAAGSAAGMITGGFQRGQTISQIKNSQTISNALYEPEYTPADIPELAGAIPNNFKIIGENYTHEDLIAFDNFLTNYGWAQNKFFSGRNLKAEINGRGDDFCFIQFGSDLDVFPCSATAYDGETATSGNTICEVLKRELQAGVRLWRKATV